MTPATDFFAPTWSAPTGLSVNGETYSEIQQFLHREALLLDNECYPEWYRLLTLQTRYRIRKRDGLANVLPCAAAGHDLELPALRNRITELVAQGPRKTPTPRIRRIVANVSACFCDRTGDYAVTSYLLVTSTDESLIEKPILNAERHDCLRRTTQSFLLVSRNIMVDAVCSSHADLSILI